MISICYFVWLYIINLCVYLENKVLYVYKFYLTKSVVHYSNNTS